MEREDLAEFGKKTATQMMIFLAIENVGRKKLTQMMIFLSIENVGRKIKIPKGPFFQIFR